MARKKASKAEAKEAAETLEPKTELGGEKRTIHIGAKYSLDDKKESQREIAQLLINGLDLSIFTPEAEEVILTGKDVCDLALRRLIRDVKKAEASRAGATATEAPKAEEPAPKPMKRKTLEDLET